MKRLNRNLHDDDPAAYRLPRDRELASQYTLLYELSLPQGLDATNMIAPDYGSTRLVASLGNLDSSAVLAFERRAGAWLDANAPLVDERHGGINLMFAHIARRNVAAMIEGNLLAAGVIGALLALALRSVGLAAVSLFTNLVPIAVAFSLWGYVVGEIGLSLSTAFGMTLGIVVDDTVHMLTRYRVERRGGLGGDEAVQAALASVGPALILTTLLLVLGFACLAASSFRLNSDLAVITIVTVTIALAVDVLVLPALLARGRVRRASEGGADERLAPAGPVGYRGVRQPELTAAHREH